jgi:hypothetical protein
LREALRKAVGQFLDPGDLDVRAYILRHMNAYFVIEASSLSQATVDGLAVLAGQQPSFVVFADTNFVFSVLGLHAEHVNEAAHQLVQLIASVTRRVEVKLCILPPTVSEMHAALEMERDDLTEVRWTPNIARGALESGSLGDVGRHFAAACIKANRTLNPRDYFEPYIDNPVATLRARGVELFNANFDAYYESRGVEQDIKRQMVAQERIAKGARRSRAQARAPAKSKAQIKHDTMLWHFVRDKRPAQVDSPIDAKYWILTEDFRFIAFDTAKRGRNQGDVPICVHPLALIQMLQFWAGRTPELEQALVGSLRMSFLFQPFDANAERVTVRILERLSSYEDAHDLPQQVITATLLNQAIRQRIEANPSEQEEAAIIKEAVTTGFKTISDSLAADRDRIAAEREIEASRRREAEEGKAAAAGEAGALTAQLTSTIAALNQAVTERDAERSARAGLERRITQLVEQAQHQADEAMEAAQRVTVRRHVRAFLILEVLLPGAAAIAVATIAGWLYYIRRGDLLLAWQKMTIATALMILVGALFYIDQRGKRNQVVMNCRWFQRYHAIHGWLYVVVLTGVLINFATDLLKWLVS